MADRVLPSQPRELLGVEDVDDVTHPPVEAQVLAVARGDTGALLTAMLECMQSEVGEIGGLRMAKNAENAAHGGTSLGRRGAEPCHGFHGSASLLTERRGFVRAAGLCARPRSARVEP